MNKYNYNYDANDYKTPPELYQKALDRWHIRWFELDTCCTDENIPALFYYKKKECDGLQEPWKNFSWCNPPFNECKKWIEKAYKENLKGKNIVMLIPVRTETKYWHDFILYNPKVKIDWLKKGYCFLNSNEEKMGIFKNALALVYFNA